LLIGMDSKRESEWFLTVLSRILILLTS